MKLEDQVCSFEQAKRLKNLIGVLDHNYAWYEISRCSNLHDTIVPILHRKGEFWEGYGSKLAEYPAYTAAELGVLLPEYFGLEEKTWWMRCEKCQNEWFCYYDNPRHYGSSLVIHSSRKDTEAQTRAEALIWLIENDHLEIQDLKL